MTDVPPSPAARLSAPGWLDARFVSGVFLVLVSVVAVATLLARADDTVGVYAATRPVAAGEVLSGADVTVVQVDLPDPARYVLAGGRAPEGQVLGRALGAGELLPVGAVLPPDRLEPTRLVSLPVDRLHVSPGLTTGDLVDVYATTAAADQVVSAQVVLEQARVVSTSDDESALAAGGGSRGVVVEVAPEEVGPLVLALQGGRLDLVTVRSGREAGSVSSAAPVLVPEGEPVAAAPAAEGVR